MKIKDLPQFNFYIGNTTDEDGNFVADVVATNDGILEDDELVSTYDCDDDIKSVVDLKEVIGNAIMECNSFSNEDCEGLSEVLYNDASITIEGWWKENYE